jgi:hypothetical protein
VGILFHTHEVGYTASKRAPNVFCISGTESSLCMPAVGTSKQSATEFYLHYGRWHSKIKRKMSQHGRYLCLSL